MKFIALSFLSLFLLNFSANADSVTLQIQSSASKKNNPILQLRNINRNYDGTGNNPKYPNWGSVNSDLERFCAPNYQDGISKMWTQKPNIRLVSNVISSIDDCDLKIDKNGINLLLPIYGQFIDHDITLTVSGQEQSAPIQVPMCDLKFDPQCKGNVSIPFNRAAYNKKKIYRTNLNGITAWLDASNIYGSSKQTGDKLRTFCNGKILTSKGGMLLKDDKGNYVSGDFRVNQNIGLTSIHTVFVRQHNRICDDLIKRHPKLTDNQIYTIARNYVIGLIQHITYDEYLPLLIGKKNFEQYIGCFQYMANINPNIYTEFSGAGYRLHSLVWEPFTLNDDKKNVIKTLKQGETYSNPSLVSPQGISQIFNGMLQNPMKQRSLQLNNQLRNSLLIGSPSHKVDLFSTNMQRGRDSGICSIPCLRQQLGLSPKKKFEQIFQNKEKAGLLQQMYQQLQSTDLYLAILGEKLVDGAVLGQIGIKLNAFQFKRIRNGDRFWYEYAYPNDIVREIKSTSFADLLKRNIGIKCVNQIAFKKV